MGRVDLQRWLAWGHKGQCSDWDRCIRATTTWRPEGVGWGVRACRRHQCWGPPKCSAHPFLQADGAAGQYSEKLTRSERRSQVSFPRPQAGKCGRSVGLEGEGQEAVLEPPLSRPASLPWAHCTDGNMESRTPSFPFKVSGAFDLK